MGRMKPVLAIAVLIVICCTFGAAAALRQDDTLKVSVDLVNVPFTVTDRHGRFVSGLTAKDFLVEEDGRRQEIRHFARENELPLTLALLIDTSPSVRPVFDEEKATASAFLESVMRQKDLALVIGFDRSVTLVQDYTENIASLKRAIVELETGGGTSVFDAVYLACKEKLDQRSWAQGSHLNQRRRGHDEQIAIQRRAARCASKRHNHLQHLEQHPHDVSLRTTRAHRQWRRYRNAPKIFRQKPEARRLSSAIRTRSRRSSIRSHKNYAASTALATTPQTHHEMENSAK